VVTQKPDWLSRALGRSGALPLVEAERAIREGRVTVNGKTVQQPLSPVRAGDRLRVDGTEVAYPPPTLALMFHKPAGAVTAPVDKERLPTAFDLMRGALPKKLQGYEWHAIGRLDRKTTGLLLFTNDERLVAHATDPTRGLTKRYIARVGAAPDESKLEPLRRGMSVDGVRYKPAKVRVREDRVVEVEITEGKNHQVLRMLGAVGLPVLALHREAVGQVKLENLPEGALRQLTPEEIKDGLGFTP
jgi:23S rRNA pseudouridine2605 synthase/16S rRNA pseudouridine516 synthase